MKDNDKDCRFQLPREQQKETHVDEDGSIVLKCNNGAVNGYNPTIVTAMRCNMDVKPIGSGTMAMAMYLYVGNYVIKTSLDTAFMFSALCAGIKAIKDSPPKTEDGQEDIEERRCLLMVKTVNQLIGKRELSGQQVATELMNWPTKYTNRKFPKFYWTRMLREICPAAFKPKDLEKEQVHLTDTEDPNHHDGQPEDTLLEKDAEMAATEQEDEEDTIVLNEHELLRELDEETEGSADQKLKSRLYNDIFFRPPTLKKTDAWELFTKYEKKPLPKSKKRQKEYHCFAASHPQYTSHCMKKLTETEQEMVPVLVGLPIPRADKEEDKTAYHIAMRALFKPWSEDTESPLKGLEMTWEDAYMEMMRAVSVEQRRIIDNMQLVYKSRDAKDDFSAARRKRAAELARSLPSNEDPFEENGEGYDPVWENAMQSSLDEGQNEDNGVTDSIDTLLVGKATASSGFYQGSATPKSRIAADAKQADEEDAAIAKTSMKELAKRREQYLSERFARVTAGNVEDARRRRETNTIPEPTVTSREEEEARKAELVKMYADEGTSAETAGWCSWQKIAGMLVKKHNLNDKQTLAFLLLADQVAAQRERPEGTKPLRMLVTGPGGTGKSRIFEAWTEYHTLLGVSDKIRLTGPTGVVASDIGRSTTHSELSLCVSRDNMKADTPSGKKIRQALERNWQE
jgi:hypothetical protein